MSQYMLLTSRCVFITLLALSCPVFFILQDADSQRVMLRLSKEYPGDLGILMPLMLNLLQLKPGLAFFMTVDEPHAYLRGDILEVRLTSLEVIWQDISIVLVNN